MIQTNYDIVKAHGGEIKVETKEREARLEDSGRDVQLAQGSEFIIVLPLF
ncbi:MAG: hypothetical protein ABI185_07000 [Ginsengibacter sp.]